MELPRITGRRCLELVEPIGHPAVKKPFNPKSLLLFASQSSKPLCTSSHDRTPTPEHSKIVDGLISIFIRQPISPENPELQLLGSSLSTGIVESVLKGLRSWKIANLFFSWASNQSGYRHTCYTYNAMAAILSRARQNDSLRVLAMDMVNSGCSMTPGALGFLLRCLGDQGLVQEANSLFDQVRKMGLCVPSGYSYTCLLEAISKSSNVDLIDVRLKEMRDLGWDLDKYTLTPVLQVYCNSGELDKALSVFNQILSNGWVDEHVLSILVLSFSKWGKVDKASELIESIEHHNVRLNEKTCCVLIHGFVKVSRVDMALMLFDKMQNLGYVPDISIFDVLIGALCEHKDLNKALSLCSKMKELGMYPDARILAKLIPSLSEEGEIIRFLLEGQEDLNAKDTTLIYNAVLSSLINNGSVEKAYLLLRAIVGNEFDAENEICNFFKGKEFLCVDATSFSIVIDGLCKTERLDVALILYQDMVRIGCRRNVLLYNNLMERLCISDRLEEAYNLLSEMETSGLKPTRFTHNSIFGCLCRRGDVEGAVKLMKEMRIHGHEPWIKYYTLLVKQLCKHGKAELACEFLAKMVQEGFIPDVIAYSAAIDGFVSFNQVDRALELFRDVCTSGHCPDVVSYNIMINGLCKDRRISEAQDIVDEMLTKGLAPSVVTYNSMINGWCKSGDVDKAMLCFSRMAEEEREPNIVTYTTLIDGLCNAVRPLDAIVLWKEMPRKGCVPNRIAFMALINGLTKCGRPDDALAYFREMEKNEMSPDSYIYTALISALIDNQNSLLAFELLEKMVQERKTPLPSDKNYLAFRNAVIELSKDVITSSFVKDLISEGSLPMVSLAELESQADQQIMWRKLV